MPMISHPPFSWIVTALYGALGTGGLLANPKERVQMRGNIDTTRVTATRALSIAVFEKESAASLPQGGR